jgi:hypothetical protein
VLEIKALAIKNHGRKAKIIFRYGFDYLRNIVVNLNEKMDDFLDVLHFLSCTEGTDLQYGVFEGLLSLGAIRNNLKPFEG